ncbi:hypothetical protein DDW11_04670 [Sulfolobus sp. SCGC AB-777_G06]|nr:hypothetical protein DDW11_04670 [Sulfolobus sp. SCGC AB-777_G06]
MFITPLSSADSNADKSLNFVGLWEGAPIAPFSPKGLIIRINVPKGTAGYLGCPPDVNLNRWREWGGGHLAFHGMEELELTRYPALLNITLPKTLGFF